MASAHLPPAGRCAARWPSRYVAGMSPGYRIGHGLGGNVRGLSRAEVNRWRNAYIAERARQGVAGFAEFHFVFENSRTTVMQDAARAVARGLALEFLLHGADAERGFRKKHAGTASMTAMTSITLGLVLIVFCVLVLIWGFPTLPKR